MDKRNSISVIIVTFNAEQGLATCIESIRSQDRKDIEVIIIDGGSSDHTIQIIKENSSTVSYWQSEPDQGIYDAMNKGLKFVTTDRIFFLGSDDKLLPDFSEMLNKLENPSTIYYANVLYKGQKHSGKINPYHFAKLGMFHQSIIYPAAVFKTYKYNTKYKIAADYALNMSLHRDPNFDFIYVDYIIANYNDTGISGTTKDLPFEADKGRMILKNFGLKIWLRYAFRTFKAKFKST